MSKADLALERVQNLYVMQMKLLDLLESDLSDPVVRKEVRANMKQFEQLLSRADWRYMGGLDVWETLQSLPKEMMQKLKTSSMPAKRVLGKKTKPAKKAVVKVRRVNKAGRFGKAAKRK